METIKKVVERITVISGNTGNTAVSIHPDLNATYYLKLNLVSEIHDMGFFDAFIEESGSTTTEYDYTPTPNDDTIVPIVEEPEIPPIQVNTSSNYTISYVDEGGNESDFTDDGPSDDIGGSDGIEVTEFGTGYYNFTVYNNRLIENGGVAIVEYGILYAQDDILNDMSDLVYDGATVFKNSVYGYLAPNTYYNSNGSELSPALTTSYRAFAKNENDEIAYGSIIDISPAMVADFIGTTTNTTTNTNTTSTTPVDTGDGVVGEEFDE